MEKGIIKLLTETPQILNQLYTDLAQPSIKKIGLALETIFDLSNTILLPIKLINKKSKIIFKKNIELYSEKLKNINENDICSVPAEIGIPIIDKFTYITNDEIRELFSTLLAKASSIKTIEQAHPGFIPIINRLSVDEAKILNYICDHPFICHITFRSERKDGETTFNDFETRLTHFSINLIFPENKSLYFDNLISLGIIKNFENYFKMDYYYKGIIEYHNKRKDEINKEYSNTHHPVEILKGFYEVTEFGKHFIETCLDKKVGQKITFIPASKNEKKD